MNDGYAILASNLTKDYGSPLAVDHVDLAVRLEEVLDCWGPTGLGNDDRPVEAVLTFEGIGI